MGEIPGFLKPKTEAGQDAAVVDTPLARLTKKVTGATEQEVWASVCKYWNTPKDYAHNPVFSEEEKKTAWAVPGSKMLRDDIPENLRERAEVSPPTDNQIIYITDQFPGGDRIEFEQWLDRRPSREILLDRSF